MEKTLNLHLRLDQKSTFYTSKMKNKGGEKAPVSSEIFHLSFTLSQDKNGVDLNRKTRVAAGKLS